MTTKSSVSVKLDARKLLGFDQSVDASDKRGKRPLGSKVGNSKVGFKPSTKY